MRNGASLLVAACQSPQPAACVLSSCNRPGLATCRCCTPTDCTSNGGGAAPTAPRIHLPTLPLGPAAAGLSHIGSSILDANKEDQMLLELNGKKMYSKDLRQAERRDDDEDEGGGGKQ